MNPTKKMLQAAGMSILAASLFSACAPSAQRTDNLLAPSLSAREALSPLNRPIHLGADSTLLVLADLLPPNEQADSVFDERGVALQIQVVPGLGEAVVMTEQPEAGMGFLKVWYGGEHLEVPTFKSRSGRITLRADATPKAKVFVMGDFNGWNRSSTPLVETADGAYEISLTLPVGKHPYQFVIDSAELPDPNNPDRVPNGFGGFNSMLTVGNPDAIPPRLRAEWRPGPGGTDQVELFGDPGAEVWAYWNDQIYGRAILNETGRHAFGVPAAAYLMGRSDLRFWSANDMQHSDVVRLPLIAGDLVRHPDQFHRQEPSAMIMYFLMVDRFVNGDPANDRPVDDPGIRPEANHLGGDLAGVRAALSDGYFDSLGVNTVWVSPIVRNPEGAWGYWQDPNTDITSKFSGYHGYWPVRSTEVDDRFGTMGELKQLTDDLHANEMNLILDYVANHVHEEHPVYQLHPDWATELYLPDGRMNTQLWDEQRLTTWFDTFMPSLDFSRPEVVETMTDSAAWWIENTDIDGFRHDATKHIPESFWRALTAKVRRSTAGQSRSVFQIGETYGSPALINSYINRGMLDAQFDFNLYDAAVDAFANGASNFDHLLDVARKTIATYGADHLMGNITGNQDRARFTSLAEGTVKFDEDHKFAGWTRSINHKGVAGYARMRQLQAFTLSMPGIPCLYYGDEIADVGGNDPDNRRMLRREHLNENELRTREHFSDFARLRQSRMSLVAGLTTLEVPQEGVLAIRRTYPGETTTVLINKSGEKRVIPVKAGTSLLAGDGELVAASELGDAAVVIPALGTAAIDN